VVLRVPRPAHCIHLLVRTHHAHTPSLSHSHAITLSLSHFHSLTASTSWPPSVPFHETSFFFFSSLLLSSLELSDTKVYEP